MGLWKLIRRVDTKRMRTTCTRVAREAHRPSPMIFCDMVWCGFRYRAGYLDYELFRFWELSSAQRASVLTRGKNDQYVAALNDRAEWDAFEVKPEFLARFAPHVKRRWLDLTVAGPEALQAFGEALGSFIVKPRDASHGDDVEKLQAAQVEDWAALHARLLERGQTLCEEIIRQHPALDAIWPGSINTIRMVTILKDGQAHVVAAYLRVGNGPRPVDNFNNGGMVAPVDRETGVVLCRARDKAGHLFERHPATGTRFEGTQLPMWGETLALLQEAAQVVPSIRYVGWDVAVTPEGPLLVEGNQYPGHDIYGLPGQSPDHMGILPVFDAVVPYRSLGV